MTDTTDTTDSWQPGPQPAPDQAPAPAPEEAPAAALRTGQVVRHRYADTTGAERVRYGLVVDADGPLVGWLAATEDAAHLADQLEAAG